MAFTDFEGTPINLGDRIVTIAWGGPIPLVLCGTRATVVGFGRTRIRVRFDDEAYGGRWGEYRAIPAGAYVRKIND